MITGDEMFLPEIPTVDNVFIEILEKIGLPSYKQWGIDQNVFKKMLGKEFARYLNIKKPIDLYEKLGIFNELVMGLCTLNPEERFTADMAIDWLSGL